MRIGFNGYLVRGRVEVIGGFPYKTPENHTQLMNLCPETMRVNVLQLMANGTE